MENIKNNINKIALPASISLMITAIYSACDMFFVAKLGTAATAAVGVAFAITAIIQAIGFAIGMGAGTLVAVEVGEEKYSTAGKIAVCAMLIGLMTGCILALAGNIWTVPILKVLGGSSESIRAGEWYTRIILVAAIPMIGTFILNNTLRAEGKASYASIVVLGAGIINIILDPIFIYVCNLKTTGVAIALIISQTISFCCMLYVYLGHKSKLMICLHKKWDFSYVRQIISNGMPGIYRQGFASISAIVLNRLAVAYGDEAVAAMSINNRIYMISFSIIIGYGQALQTVTGHNVSVRDQGKIYEAYRYSIYKCASVIIVVSVINFAIANDVVRVFAAGRKNTLHLAAAALKTQSAVFIFMVLPVMCNMVYQGMKCTKISSYIASLRQGIVFIPIVFVMNYIWGINGIIIAQPVADILSFIIILPTAIKINKKFSKMS